MAPEQAMQQILLPRLQPYLQNMQVVSIRRDNQMPQRLHLTPDQTASNPVGATARIRFTQNGQPMEAELCAVESYLQQQIPGVYGTETCTVWMLNAIHLMIAPAGSLDNTIPQMEQMLSTCQINPQWKNAANQKTQQATRSNIAASNRNFQAMQKAHQTVQSAYDASNASWEANQATMDKSAEKFDDYINDQQDWTDPNTGVTKKYSDQYEYMWSNGTDDQHIGTDNPNYNPNIGGDQDYYQLQHK